MTSNNNTRPDTAAAIIAEQKQALAKAHRKIHEQRKQLRRLGALWAAAKRGVPFPAFSDFVKERGGECAAVVEQRPVRRRGAR